MPNTPKLGSLHKLFLLKLRALLDVETQILKALPKLIKKASDPDLRRALEEHLEETRNHESRLNQAFKHLDEKPQKTRVEAIRGMAEDAEWVLKNVPKGPALDAAIIGTAQYVEHYEIAGYGTAVEWAELMGHEEVKDLLAGTLEEEKGADSKLMALAKERINSKVEIGMGEEDDREKE